MNRFFDIEGAVSVQLAPWILTEKGLPINEAIFKLIQPIRFKSDIAGGVIVVAEGMLSDLASIPKLAQGIFLTASDPRIALGAWIHDDLYNKAGVIVLEEGITVSLTRKECDKILAFEAMPDLGATTEEQIIVYQALRKFGTQWAKNSFLERLS